MSQQSLYVTLGIAVISTVTLIMAAYSTYHYISTKNEAIEKMEHSATTAIVALKRNITQLVASYAINEYDQLVLNEMKRQSSLAIIVEDYNMGKILGTKTYLSGQIQAPDGAIVSFDPNNGSQAEQLETCCHAYTEDIVTTLGQKIGTITIYTSNKFMKSALNEIILETLLASVLIALLLITSLLIILRFFILKPILKIITTVKNCDNDGIPLELMPTHGATEILALSTSMNHMISSIRASRVTLKEQHHELESREEQLQTLSMATEQSPVSILICSSDNIIEYANPQFITTSGLSTGEIIGQSISILFQYNEQDKQQLEKATKTLALNKKWIGEITPRTKEEEPYTLRISASTTTSPQDSPIAHNIYVAEDITEFKRNEEILRNSQKMDAVGQLSGGIAHDFNNMLGIIMGNLELLKDSLNGQPKEIARIEQALASTLRGAQLTRKLLNFSRQDRRGQKLTQINSFIENIHELIAKSVTATIQVEVHLQDDLWLVNIEPGDLEDAILNLSLNARDAMSQGGSLIIETANKYLDANFVKSNPLASVGEHIMISVSDTGTGIPENIRKKIYDPFFTTKAIGKGTGLGLSMVYGFVQRSNGYIELYTDEGSGTSFHIYLPRATSDQALTDQTEEPGHRPHGNETILIVDDEVDLALLAEEYLKTLGYHTRVAHSAKEALTILSTTEEIDLIFTDVIMPVTDGFNLSFAAIQQQPSIKVLLTSGFTSKRMELSNGKQTLYFKLSETLLGKPYNLSELAMAIRRTLDEQERL